MTAPMDPELRNAVLGIIGVLTGLELGEDAAVLAILNRPLTVSEARTYIGALIVLCQQLVAEVAGATDAEVVEVLRQMAEAIGR
jgi:hypothetical protein